MTVHQLVESRRPEAVTARMERLRVEAQAIAKDHLVDFEGLIGEARRMAEEISAGGEAYGVGAREIARRLAGQLQSAALTLETLRTRKGA
ncbi:MAG: hypothetical protein ACRED9_03350 [Caulobacteraceae bacterium]